MRTLKFRMWNKKTKTMLQHNQIMFDISDWNCNEERPVLQFTDLLDSNDVEIYEGDIIKHTSLHGDEFVGYIYWESPTYVIRHKIRDEKIPLWNGGEGHIKQWNDGEHDWYGIENLETCYMEVIGNRFEHPSLLESSPNNK